MSLTVPAWYLRSAKDLDESPSLKDGLKVYDIALNCEQACRFIHSLGKKLGFPLRTINTSQLYFHIFYAQHSMKSYPHLVSPRTTPRTLSRTWR